MNFGTNIPVHKGVERLVEDAKLRHSYNFMRRQPKDYHNLTSREDRLNREAVVMLTLIASVHYYTSDLAEELTALGIYRHGIKRVANRVDDIINEAHAQASALLKRCNQGAGYRAYNDCMDAMYGAVESSVALEGAERVYNIILAMCRLVGDYVEHRIGAYDFRPAREVAKVPALMVDIPIKDYHLDNIIDIAVRPIIFER